MKDELRDDASVSTTATAATDKRISGLKRELEMRESLDTIKTQVVNNMVKDVKKKESQIKSLKANIKALEKRNAEVEGHVKVMETSHGDASMNKRRAEQRSSALETKVASMSKELKEVKVSNKTLQTSNLELTGRSDNTQKQLDQTLSEKEKLSTVNEAHSLKLSALSNRINELETRETSLECSNKELQEANEKIQKLYDDFLARQDEDGKSSVVQISTLQNSNDMLTQSVKDKENRIAELEQQEKTLENMNSSLKEDFEDSQKQLDRMIAANKALTETSKKEQVKMATYSREVAKLQSKESYLEGVVEELRDELVESRKMHCEFKEQKEDEASELTSKISILQELNGNLEETIKVNQQQILELEKTEKCLEASNAQLKKEISDSQVTHNEAVANQKEETKLVSHEMTRLRKVNSELSQSLETSKQRVAELEPNKKFLEIENQNLKHEIEEARKSNDELVEQKKKDSFVYSHEINRLKDTNEKLKTLAKNTDNLFVESKAVNKKLNAEIDQEKQKSADLSTHICKLESKVESVKRSNKLLKSRLEEAIKKNSDLGVHLGDEKRRFASEISYWKDMNEKLFESLSTAKQNLDTARTSYEKQAASHKQMESEVASLTEKLYEQGSQATEEAFAKQESIESLERTNKKLLDKRNELDMECKEKQTTIAKLSSQLAEKKETIEALENEIKDLNQQVKLEKTKSSDLTKQIQEDELHFTAALNAGKERCLKLEHSLTTIEGKLKDSTAANTKLIAEGKDRREKIKKLREVVILDLRMDIRKLEAENEMLHDKLDEAKAQFSGLKNRIDESKKKFKAKIKEQEQTIDVGSKKKKALEEQLKEAQHHANKQTHRILEMEKERQAMALRVLDHNVQHVTNPPQLYFLSEELLSVPTDGGESTDLIPNTSTSPDPLIQIPAVGRVSPVIPKEILSKSKTSESSCVSDEASEGIVGAIENTVETSRTSDGALESNADELDNAVGPSCTSGLTDGVDKTFTDDASSDESDSGSECVDFEKEQNDEAMSSADESEEGVGGFFTDDDSEAQDSEAEETDADATDGEETDGEDTCAEDTCAEFEPDGEETCTDFGDTDFGDSCTEGEDDDTLGPGYESFEDDRPEKEADGWFWNWIEPKATMEGADESEKPAIEMAKSERAERTKAYPLETSKSARVERTSLEK